MAFADEWLAYYQYWLGAKVVKGPMKEAVIAELLQHAPTISVMLTWSRVGSSSSAARRLPSRRNGTT
jgi:hypothetical protein